MLKNILENKKLLLILFLTLIGGFLLYRNFTSGGASKKVSTAKVKQGNLAKTLTISGTINADEHVILRFQTSGRLSWVGIKEGDYVKKYQTIAALDQREVRKKLENELYDYMKTRWDFEEAKRETYKDKLFTDTIKRILEKNQFDLNKAVLDVELQNLTVEYSSLWTPIEGVITKIGSPYAGVNITPTTAEFEIVNPKTVYFSATADQTEVVSLLKGMNGDLVLDAYPNTTISGIIRDISFTPKSGEASTVYEIKFDFPNQNDDYKYRLGMAGDLTFVTASRENVLYIPSKFIKSQNGKKYLTVKKNGKLEKVEVKTGMETETETEITSGLSIGETVYD